MKSQPFYSELLQIKLDSLLEDSKCNIPFHTLSQICLETLTFFHQELDIWKGKNTTNICKNHCSHCCNHWVDGLDSFEALAIYSQIKTRNDFADILTSFFERDTLFEQFSIKNSEYEESLNLYFKSNLTCPTLSPENTCSIYKYRPIICSLYQAQTSPDFCKPNTIEDSVDNNQILEIDIRHQKTLSKIDSQLASFNIPESYFQAMLYLFENETGW